jgi:hypothetical protein
MTKMNMGRHGQEAEAEAGIELFPSTSWQQH